MKRTNFAETADTFSVAMSKETGCVVVIKNGAEIVGSMTREQSMLLGDVLLKFVPPAIRRKATLEVVNGSQP